MTFRKRYRDSLPCRQVGSDDLADSSTLQAKPMSDELAALVAYALVVFPDAKIIA